MVREFKPCVGLRADVSEPGACFGFCVSLPLRSFPTHTLSLSLTLKNKHYQKNKKINKSKKSECLNSLVFARCCLLSTP